MNQKQNLSIVQARGYNKRKRINKIKYLPILIFFAIICIAMWCFFTKIYSNFKGGSILGGKTGYTPEAGQCLASLAIKGGKYYILVTAGANGDNKTQKLHIDDAFTIYSSILFMN